MNKKIGIFLLTICTLIITLGQGVKTEDNIVNITLTSNSLIDNQIKSGFSRSGDYALTNSIANYGADLNFHSNGQDIYYQTNDNMAWRRVPSYYLLNDSYEQPNYSMVLLRTKYNAYSDISGNWSFSFITHIGDPSVLNPQVEPNTPHYTGYDDDIGHTYGTLWMRFRYALDTQGPTVIGDLDFVSYMSTRLTESQIRACFTAIDDYSGNVPILLIHDDYTHQTRPGVYQIRYRAVDQAGNENNFTVNVHLRDNIAPTINDLSGDEDIIVSYTEFLDIDSYIRSRSIIVSDNVSIISADNFAYSTSYRNTSRPGTYTLTIRYQDEANNTGFLIKRIRVIDDVAPIIEGPDTIQKKFNEVLSINEIISKFSAHDEIDGVTRVEISYNGLTGNAATLGEYSITISSKDNSNNTSTKTLIVKVIDINAPIVYLIDSKYIIVNQGEFLTFNDLVSIMKYNNLFSEAEATSITILEDEYTPNFQTLGLHQIKLHVISENGQEREITQIVEVRDSFAYDETPNLKFNLLDWLNNEHNVLGIILTGWLIVSTVAGIFVIGTLTILVTRNNKNGYKYNQKYRKRK